jgi:hypothetical protein
MLIEYKLKIFKIFCLSIKLEIKKLIKIFFLVIINLKIVNIILVKLGVYLLGQQWWHSGRTMRNVTQLKGNKLAAILSHS